jgi:hypothetical protein
MVVRVVLVGLEDDDGEGEDLEAVDDVEVEGIHFDVLERG